MIDKKEAYVILNKVPYQISMFSCSVQLNSFVEEDDNWDYTNYFNNVQPAYVVFSYCLENEEPYSNFKIALDNSEVVGLYTWRNAFTFSSVSISERKTLYQVPERRTATNDWILKTDYASSSIILKADYTDILFQNDCDKYPSDREVSDILESIFSRQ